MQTMLTEYADPTAATLGSLCRLETLDWLHRDLRRLYKSFRNAWTIVEPPPQTLSAVEMEQQLRGAVQETRVLFRRACVDWVVACEADALHVTEEDIEALDAITEGLASLKMLKGGESVRRHMLPVLAAARACRERGEVREESRAQSRELRASRRRK